MIECMATNFKFLKGHYVGKEYQWWKLLRPQVQDKIVLLVSNAIEHKTWNSDIERDLQTKFKLTQQQSKDVKTIVTNIRQIGSKSKVFHSFFFFFYLTKMQKA